MIKLLKANRAQAVMGEYVMVFFLVVGMIAAMTIYFKRSVQARIFDARNTMLNTVVQRADAYYTEDLASVIQFGYEPYYANTASAISRSSDTEKNLLSGGSSGIFSKTMGDQVTVIMKSETAPPGDAE